MRIISTRSIINITNIRSITGIKRGNTNIRKRRKILMSSK